MITESTQAKIRAAIEADPTRWRTNGGNENGTRETTIDGHDLVIGWDPLDEAYAVYEQTAGSCDLVAEIGVTRRSGSRSRETPMP
jgi:hypothetical protein